MRLAPLQTRLRIGVKGAMEQRGAATGGTDSPAPLILASSGRVASRTPGDLLLPGPTRYETRMSPARALSKTHRASKLDRDRPFDDPVVGAEPAYLALALVDLAVKLVESRGKPASIVPSQGSGQLGCPPRELARGLHRARRRRPDAGSLAAVHLPESD
jgi:hypothetical protein